MYEIMILISLIIVFFISANLKIPYVLASVITASFIVILNLKYNILNNQTGNLSIFSQIAIPLIFFSLGLGYNLKTFFNIIKKTFVPSLIDTLNLFVPFIILYLLTNEFFTSLVLGLILYPSSTAIVVKILEFQKKLVSKTTDIVIGILLFEDILLIIILTILDLQTKNQNDLIILKIILTIFMILIIYLLSNLLNKYSLFFEKYLQEEIGVLFIFGYFFIFFSVCEIFHLPEVLIMFLAGLSIPQQLSSTIKPKIEIIKNFSIAIFIMDFIFQSKITTDLNIIILLLSLLFIFLKILTTYIGLLYSKTKIQIKEIFYLIPRGEFSVYFSSKFNGFEIIGLSLVVLSNLIFTLILLITPSKEKQKFIYK